MGFQKDTQRQAADVTPPPADTTPPPRWHHILHLPAITPPPSQTTPPPAGGSASTMSFFVTSSGTGTNAGNYGGLSGADDMCKRLARNSTKADAREQNWVAYLSNAYPANPADRNAIDRIGAGPWYNFDGTEITKPTLSVGIPMTIFSMNGDKLSNELISTTS